MKKLGTALRYLFGFVVVLAIVGAAYQLFASADGIIGMVFVDSSQEQQRHRLNDPGNTAQQQQAAQRQLTLCRALAWTGAVRVSGVMKQMAEAQHVPENPAVEMVAMENRTNYCAGIAHEAHGFESDVSQADPPATLGDLPLVVLTRGRASSPKDFPTPLSQAELEALDQSWLTLQNELAALSTHSSHRIVKDSGHMIPLQAPDAVVGAVRDTIERRI
jgi:pimeloyl-ACP methyl ester carboxylesterase